MSDKNVVRIVFNPPGDRNEQILEALKMMITIADSVARGQIAKEGIKAAADSCRHLLDDD